MQAWWSPARLIDAVMLCLLLTLPRGPQFTVSPEQSQRAGLGKPPTHWLGLRLVGAKMATVPGGTRLQF